MTRPFGSFFEEVTGQPVPESVHEMLEIIEAKQGRKLTAVSFPSTVVPCREVFPVSHVDMKEVDRQIDEFLHQRK